MEYSSIREIVADQGLNLGDVEPTADAVRKAIDDKLRSLQSETVAETPEIYRQLINARDAIDKLDTADGKRVGTELIPIPTAMLERLLDAIQKPPQITERKGSTAIERMQSSRSVAITKASQDYRNRRKLPFAGLGALSATLWSTRQAFGANLSGAGTLVWTAVAGVILLVAISLFAATSRTQNSDENILRRLYDPDIQAIALDLMPRNTRRRFARAVFRKALWYVAHGPEVESELSRARSLGIEESLLDIAMTYPGPQERKGLHRLSTTDFLSALDDSSELALDRFVEMDVLRSKQVRGRERFEFIEHADS